ncbi:MAG TPA: HDOD domain-containing protein [Planctomycetota bacterium]|nr:HDOD domain-containing protein [Planctomycetota bacterium]
MATDTQQLNAATEPMPPAVLERFAEKLRAGKLDLPVLPEVAGQVVQVTQDPATDARKLADLIHRDPALAGNLMRLVNSAVYATSSPIVSLQQAISRLGLAKIREIALIISCQSKVFAVQGYQPLVRGWFRHSLAAAAFAQEVARSRRWNVEEAFLCGLLHDVGRPVLLQTLVDLHGEVGCHPNPAALSVAITTLHTRIGADLVKGWALPARLSETIQYHHDPAKAPTAAANAHMTSLADDLAHLALGPRRVGEAEVRAHPSLAALNIYPEEMDALLAKREQVVRTVEALG